jgi:hypothetical protein
MNIQYTYIITSDPLGLLDFLVINLKRGSRKVYLNPKMHFYTPTDPITNDMHTN